MVTAQEKQDRKNAAKIELTKLITQAGALRSKGKPITNHLICKMGHAARRAEIKDDVFAKKMFDELDIDAQRLAEVAIPVPRALKAAEIEDDARELASVS